MKIIFYILCSIGFLMTLACSSSNKLSRYGAIGPDKSLYYYHKGSGEPILVVHGGPGMNHAYLLPHLDRLASTHHMIYYDQRACGYSEIPNDTAALSISAFVDDIEIIRQKFKLKKFNLMAHSWGVLLAVQYALKYPQQLSSLILISPAALSSVDVRESSRVMNSRFDPSDQIKRNQIIESVAFKTGQPEAMRDLIRLAFKQNMAQKKYADSLQIYIPLDSKEKNGALRYLFKDLAEYNFYPKLNRIQTPMLIVVGDQELGIQISVKIKKEIPGALYKTVQGAGHFPFVEQPGLFDTIIRDFLSLKL